MANAGHDENHVPTLIALSSAGNGAVVTLYADPSTHRLLTTNTGGGGSGTVTEVDTGTGLTGGPITTTGTISLDSKLAPIDTLGSPGQAIRVNAGGTALEYFTLGGGTGTVTSMSVVSANGLAGTVATATTTPAITLSTTVTGLLKGDGTTISAATAGTDYVTASSTNTFTNKTYDTAGTGNSFSINGVAVTANTGTGAVARAASPAFTTPAIGVATGTSLTVSGILVAGTNTGTNGSLKLFGSTSGDVTVKAAAAAGTATNFQLPATNGSNTNVLQTDGSGNTSWVPAAAGTVTAVSVASANGFAGSSSGGATPALTISTSINSPILAGNGTAISGATTTGSGTTAVLSTTPTFTTSLISPKIIGGTGTTGTQLTLQTTSGTGTTDALVIVGGSNGATTFATFSSAVLSLGTSATFTTGTIELGAATDTTLSRSAAGVLAVEGVVIPSISSTNTLTNKRVTRRLVTVSGPGATPSTNTDNVDVANFTVLAANITSMSTSLTGTPTDGQLVEFRFTDNGTARTITWGGSFGSTTVTLPATTVISTMLRVLVEWNANLSLYQCIAVA